MGFRNWFRRDRDHGPLHDWRTAWARAVETGDATATAALREGLRGQPPLADDLEVEEEMLAALEQVQALRHDLAEGRLPHVETTHRVIGTDLCHFSAPASLPDDPGQASGRVLFTSRRAVFVGGSGVTAIAWHAAREAVRADRDVLLIRSAEDAVRFRFNTYGDALAATALARHLKRSQGRPDG